MSSESRPDGRSHSRDLIFRLECLHSEILVSGKLVQYVTGRRDWITRIKKGQMRNLGCSDETQCSGLISSDVAVLSWREIRFANTVVGCKKLGRVGIIEPGAQRLGVGSVNLRFFQKFGFNPL